jgi:superfamily II DNA or RNA helicase
MPTGTGKTRVGASVVREWPGPVLWVAHREELLDQGRRDLERYTGEMVAKEKAEERAWEGARIVVGSVQTLKGDRLASFGKRHQPALIVVDEAHHAVSPSYRAILDAFPDARVLGLTATPDRADERAMGQVFESVATVYEIRQAIDDGYLCGIRLLSVKVEAIDLAGIATVAGDLNQGQLDAAMNVEKVVHGIVKPTLELAGARRTIMFTTSVENAHRMAEVFNRYRPNSARAVDGGTPLDERRGILAGHRRGDYQFLCNVGVLTEGYDDPLVSCVGMARPTKSRALYAQCAGRGLRIADGKTDCLLLDFVGNSGRHRLVSGLDILDGKRDEETLDRAAEIVEESPEGIDPQEALERAAAELEAARAREAAKRAKVTAAVKHRAQEVDPFGVFHMERGESDGDEERFGVTPSEKQLATLANAGVDITQVKTRAQASRLIGTVFSRREKGLASFKQLKTLQKYGITKINVGFTRASAIIDAIAQNGWRAPSAGQLDALMQRTPGEEG